MTRYSKINIIYLMQKWMDSVPGQTFLNYAYSWGAAVVILGTLFKLTHLPGANTMLFIGMGTEVFVFFISAFDRPFDKSTIDMTLDNHFDDGSNREEAAQQSEDVAQNAEPSQATVVGGGTVIIGGGTPLAGETIQFAQSGQAVAPTVDGTSQADQAAQATPNEGDAVVIPAVGAPAPAVTAATAAAMEEATTSYVDHLNELNEMLEKVAAQSARLATDSEEMENLNRTLTGISRVYEMQLKSASQQITTQDEINEQIRRMAQQIQELNAIYTRMIEAMTVNMSPLAGPQKPQA